ncbi:glycosyltransferase family 2 protein [Acetobacteraceae bacterium KSS8]|uniref:Glycosyltransferase family 2 protein n=1 Tax=Endosaccharibacter trunci TaxID=2812733 RepID=A0ABT1WA94_9PROT|nr:glycosyltransferase family 2 protein [Acetobacteraceae bacterium KSS8]
MNGCVDIHGYSEATGSYLLCGWAPIETADGLPGFRPVSLGFEKGTASAEGLVAHTLRDDLGGQGRGVAIHLPGSDPALGRLLFVEIEAGDGPVRLDSTAGTEHTANRALLDRMRQQRVAPGMSGERLRAVLDRSGFEGRDTLDRLDGQVAFQIDEAVATGTTGLLLSGWMLSAPDAVRTVRLRSGGRSTKLAIDTAIRLDRADVLAKHGDRLRSRQVRCGFLLPAENCLEPGEPCFVEIETVHGDVGYHPVRLSAQHGLVAIRAALANLSPRYDEVASVFDRLGPTLTALNADRLAGKRDGREIRFGRAPAEPVCSVIVPLYGRLDYMEVQVALFAGNGFGDRHELIYVVDDPAAAGAATHLADTLFRRFGVPIRLWLQNDNLGFAPACNVGLSLAAGRTVCFLNSDVFGTAPDWLDRLVADLDRLPETGIVGPLLLFEDGSVQHQGMEYAPLPEFGGWLFPTHPGKGERPEALSGLVRARVITGACMVMTRELAESLGGFDEAFVIGDFEDSDLCLRARGLGVGCAVDHDVSLFHLERKSQITGAEPWRLNVTLYNAWLHQKRWGRRLAAEAGVRADA